jgi:hypothetical protein
MDSSLRSSEPPNVNDHEALAAYIMDQMELMSSSQRTPAGSSEGAVRPRLTEIYTSYLPNYLWFQPIAADRADNMIRPTSLCSGTGITGGSQYLQPEMLKMFSVFGSYLLGSGHLFQDDREGNAGSRRRRAAFWVDTIDEDDDEDDGTVADGSVGSTSSDDGTAGSDDDDDPRRIQKEFIEKVILDLRRSQMMMEHQHPMQDYKISDA